MDLTLVLMVAVVVIVVSGIAPAPQGRRRWQR